MKKVIFVLGSAYSGTTLLGMMLGSHSDALYAGEVQSYKLSSNTSKLLLSNFCMVCGNTCPIWSDLKIVDSIYKSLSKKSGCAIIVDSSKGIKKWVEPQSQGLLETEQALIILTRDARGVVASKLRRNRTIDIKETASQWKKEIAKQITFAASFKGSVAHVRCEALATKPEETLRNICEVIGVSFEQKMLDPWSVKHHPIRCNGQTLLNKFNKVEVPDDYYATHPRAIVLDERWREELDETELREIEEKGGEAYRKYAWG